MNHFDMPIQTTFSTYLFKVPLLPNDMLQIKQVNEWFWYVHSNYFLSERLVVTPTVNGLAFSWIVLICLFKTPFCPNGWFQIKQVNGFAFSWTVWKCIFKVPFLPNAMLQIKQVNCLAFSWIVLTWVFKFAFSPNDLLQIKQVNGNSIFMNCIDMGFQVCFFSKWLVANQTSEW